MNNLRGLAIQILTDEHGISSQAWAILNDLLYVASESNDDILMSVKETEGRYYLPENWNKI